MEKKDLDKDEKMRKGIVTFISITITMAMLSFFAQMYLIKENKYHGNLKNSKKIEYKVKTR